MALSIKNQQTHDLIRKLAEITGESMTTAVTLAVRERLERLAPNGRTAEETRARYEAIMAIGREFAAEWPAEWTREAMDEWMYDENGLPRGD